MSMRVVNEVLDHSSAKATDRNVLVAFADAAHHDGVTWLPIGHGERDDKRTVCRRARCSKREAIRAIQELRRLGELQVVRVRRRSSTISVYRVVVGAIAEVEVEYDRLPFELPYRFGETPEITGSTGEEDDQVQGANLAPSPGAVHGATGEAATVPFASGHGAKSGPVTVPFPSASPYTGPSETTLDPPPLDPSVQTAATAGNRGGEEPSISDAELRDVVLSLPGAHAESPNRIRKVAQGLPRSIFQAIVDELQTGISAGRIDNACGWLTDRLRIARAERAASFSAQLAAELGQQARGYMPPPWAVDALKRDRPERYTRIVAKTMPDELLREALGQHHRDVGDFVELARAVRAGSEPDDRVGSPEQELERWLRERAALAELPTAAELEQLLAGWRGVDDVDRERALELADTLRGRAADSGAEAA